MLKLNHILLIPLFLISCAFGAEEGHLYVEGEIEKVERVWTSSSYTGLPFKMTQTLWLKVSKLSPLKKVPLENDFWQPEEGVTIIGKGYRLEPITEETVNNDAVKVAMAQIRAQTQAQPFTYSGSEDTAKFMIRAGKIWNKYKGPIEFKGVVYVPGSVGVEGKNLNLYLSPAVVKQGSEEIKNSNFRELWEEPAQQDSEAADAAPNAEDIFQ